MMTETRTNTVTETRATLLKASLRIVTMQLIGESPKVLDAISRGVEERFIRRLDFLAKDEDDYCHARLRLKIDWAAHDKLLGVRTKVRVNGRWLERGAPEVRELLGEFEKVAEERGLRVGGVLGLTSNCDQGRLLRELGLKRSKPIRWVQKPSATSHPVKRLEELEVALSLAEECDD